MKIKTSHPKLKLSNNDGFTENDLKFIKLLEIDQELEGILNRSRKRLKISLGGFNLDDPETPHINFFRQNKFNISDVYGEVIYISRLYGNLPFSWASTFMDRGRFSFPSVT